MTFVLRRVSTMAFAPRMHVFPGGRLDDADFDEEVELVDADVAAMAFQRRRQASGDVNSNSPRKLSEICFDALAAGASPTRPASILFSPM